MHSVNLKIRGRKRWLSLCRYFPRIRLEGMRCTTMLQPTCLKGCLNDSNCSSVVQKASKLLSLICRLVIFSKYFNFCFIDRLKNRLNEWRDKILVLPLELATKHKRTGYTFSPGASSSLFLLTASNNYINYICANLWECVSSMYFWTVKLMW